MERIHKRRSIKPHVIFLSVAAILIAIDQAQAEHGMHGASPGAADVTPAMGAALVAAGIGSALYSQPPETNSGQRSAPFRP